MKLKTSSPLQVELNQHIFELGKALNDSAERFKFSNGISKNQKLKSFYQKQLQNRKMFKKELDDLATQRKLRIATSATLLGAFDRLFRDMRVIFANRKERVVLKSAILREESLLIQYEQTLHNPEILGEALFICINEQKEQLEDAIVSMKKLLYE